MSQATVRTILRYPDPKLHTVAKPVVAVDDRVKQLTKDMLATMYDANGIGLAATQIDVHERVIVIDVSEERDTPLVLINPEVVWKSESTKIAEEGCLSVPGIYDGVPRAEKITVKALDENGVSREVTADELLAICIQHEMDHLQGKLFVDYLSPLKRQRIRQRLEKEQRRKA